MYIFSVLLWKCEQAEFKKNSGEITDRLHITVDLGWGVTLETALQLWPPH